VRTLLWVCGILVVVYHNNVFIGFLLWVFMVKPISYPPLSASDVQKMASYLRRSLQEASVVSSSRKNRLRPNLGRIPYWLGGPRPTPEEFRAQLRFEERQRERAYEEVRSGKSPGYIDTNGDVTVGDSFSSITYGRGHVICRGV
jgi:hypothetical protein